LLPLARVAGRRLIGDSRRFPVGPAVWDEHGTRLVNGIRREVQGGLCNERDELPSNGYIPGLFSAGRFEVMASSA
jgi:hypothetical protein